MIATNLKVGPARYCRGGTLSLATYIDQDGPIAIRIIDAETGQPEATATVNLMPDGPRPPDDHHVWLKGWEENEGIPEALAEAGHVTLTGDVARAGCEVAVLAKLCEELCDIVDASIVPQRTPTTTFTIDACFTEIRYVRKEVKAQDLKTAIAMVAQMEEDDDDFHAAALDTFDDCTSETWYELSMNDASGTQGAQGYHFDADGNPIAFYKGRQEHWDLIWETITLDGESSAFDPDLREQIKLAVDAIRED